MFLPATPLADQDNFSIVPLQPPNDTRCPLALFRPQSRRRYVRFRDTDFAMPCFYPRTATATPFTDQFLSTSWPSHGVPWIAKSPVPSSSSAAHGQKPSAAVSTGEVSARAHFTCEVPQCNRRFASSKLLGLHLRVGHSVFDLERMEEARLAARDGKYGAGPMITADGLPITRWVEVGRGLR